MLSRLGCKCSHIVAVVPSQSWALPDCVRLCRQFFTALKWRWNSLPVLSAVSILSPSLGSAFEILLVIHKRG